MDSKYFKGNRRSELQELREELQNAEKDKQKDAIKKIICAMTTGKDVSSLFPDVVNCIQTNNIELKKLVYLYVINYAKVQPELAILAVNTFCKDAKDRNPLIRALAIRTMGYIRLTAITEYLVEPLKRCQTDLDPYVRKTAAVCIAKLYGICPSLVVEEGFLDMLRDMLSDKNPMVVANAVSTLVEISELSDDNVFERMLQNDTSCLNRLLNVLNECIEWGQVYILDALVYYNPRDSADAKRIVEAVCPRFSHINSAVVMSAIKVVLKMMNKITDKEYLRLLNSKLSAPLVTLSSLEPEIQYVALRSILVVISKYPRLLEDHVRSFFCKCTDPLYVNIEKLDIMVKLATSTNYNIILNELREYATDVDLEFVKRAIKAISSLCIRLELALDSCVNAITELLKLKINHVTEECTVALRDILRGYPHVFSNELFVMCADVDYIHDAEAKAALVWIVGQYASKIDDASEYISNLAETFHEEPHPVQLSLLTAAMKVHLSCGGGELVSHVIHRCGVDSNNPDVRDRAYMYLRLLEAGDKVASKVVLSALPRIGESSLDKATLEDLLENLGRVSAIYHLPSWAVAFRDVITTGQTRAVAQLRDSSDEESSHGEYFRKDKRPDRTVEDDEDEDLFHTGLAGYICKSQVVLHSSQRGANGQLGLEISAFLYREEERISLEMKLTNKTSAVFILQAIQFNKNSFGLSPASPLSSPLTIAPGKGNECHVPLKPNQIPSNTAPENPIVLQVAIKTNLDVFYFALNLDLPIVFKHDVKIGRGEFESLWHRLSPKVIKVTPRKRSHLIKALEQLSLYYVGTNVCQSDEYTTSGESLFFYAQTTNSLALLAQISGDSAVLKAESASLIPLFASSLESVLK